MTLNSILEHVKVRSHLEYRYVLIEFCSNKHSETVSEPDIDTIQCERLDMQGRFGRKARRMSGMAASLLRAKTFQDTKNQVSSLKTL